MAKYAPIFECRKENLSLESFRMTFQEPNENEDVDKIMTTCELGNLQSSPVTGKLLAEYLRTIRNCVRPLAT